MHLSFHPRLDLQALDGLSQAMMAGTQTQICVVSGFKGELV